MFNLAKVVSTACCGNAAEGEQIKTDTARSETHLMFIEISRNGSGLAESHPRYGQTL